MVTITFHIRGTNDCADCPDENVSFLRDFNISDNVCKLVNWTQTDSELIEWLGTKRDQVQISPGFFEVTNSIGVEVPTSGPWTVGHVIEELQNTKRETSNEFNDDTFTLCLFRAGTGKRVCKSSSMPGYFGVQWTVR